jgi:hypothetical protein
VKNESYNIGCIFRHLECDSRILAAELMLCTLTPAQLLRLEEIIGQLTAIAVKHKPKETADAV